MYRLLFRRFLSRLDAENAHRLAFLVIRLLGLPVVGDLVRALTRPRHDVAVDALGLHFSSPFGLAAGFDKDARAVQGLGNLGFSHVEVGTLTARPQRGNPRPRLFRLVPDRALVNRMGFNNHGARSAARRLAAARRLPGRPVIGANIGKSRVVDVAEAIPDYVASTRALAGVCDYLVVNVSSPNTPGLRGLQEVDRLGPLLRAVQAAAAGTPLLVKISPDLSDEEIGRVVDLVVATGLDGVIATNTTTGREGLTTPAAEVDAAGEGGLSGTPLADRSLEVLRLIRSRAPRLCIISVGGVTDARDVAQRLTLGATLVQGYTAFLYVGPLWARGIARGLRRHRDGTWTAVSALGRSLRPL